MFFHLLSSFQCGDEMSPDLEKKQSCTGDGQGVLLGRLGATVRSGVADGAGPDLAQPHGSPPDTGRKSTIKYLNRNLSTILRC